MRPINPVWRKGLASKQAHRDLPTDSFERELGQRGFNGPASHVYQSHPPTSWRAFEGENKPRAYDLNQIPASDDVYELPVVLASAANRVSYGTLSNTDNLVVYRNADGDSLVFIHTGTGDLFSDLGHLEIDAGDYLVIPRGISWQTSPHENMSLLVIEATHNHFQLPERGLLGQHALFDEAVLDTPDLNERFREFQSGPTRTVVVKKFNRLNRIHYPFNPIDTIGWKGNLSIFRLNVRDILPVVSHRYHLPPSVHATFEAENLLISTFAPRPFERDPTALKVPFFHSNDDTDEVLFYHSGEFFSRDDISPGCMTFHPSGFPHGPHPYAQKKMFKAPSDMTSEYAVMIDALVPLEPATAADQVKDVDGKSMSYFDAKDCEISNYVLSWKPTKTNGA